MFNFDDLKPTARLPICITVYTDVGEVIIRLLPSMRSAQGWLAYHVREGYWYGKPERVEYTFWEGYRWD